MGVALYFFDALMRLGALGLLPSGGKVIELGQQMVPVSPDNEESARDRVRNFVLQFSGTGRTPEIRANTQILAGDIYSAAGFDYTCIDMVDGNRTLSLDLNFATAGELKDSADLVTNFGTTEHLFNQANAFVFMHDILKAGGVFMHQVPSAGYPDHCFFQYSPKFFLTLIEANGYELIDFRLDLSSSAPPVPPYWRSQQTGMVLPSSCPDSMPTNQSVNFIFRKTSATPFVVPLDLTSTYLEAGFLSRVKRFSTN